MFHQEDKDDSTQELKPSSALITSLEGKYGEDFINWFIWKNAYRPEQPSDQGIALIYGAYYAKKEGCRHQPLFADDEVTLKYIKSIMPETKIGTEVTFVFDPIKKNEKTQIERKLHRIVHKFIYTEKGITHILFDPLRGILLEDDNHSISINIKIQDDGFSCGVIAMKMARVLNGLIYSEEYINNPEKYIEKLLSELYKSCQSMEKLKKVNYPWKSEHEKKYFRTVFRELESKDQNRYSQHFAEKYCAFILNYLKQHTRDEVIKILTEYDFAEMTAHELDIRFEERKNIDIFEKKIEHVLKLGKNPNMKNAQGETLLEQAIQLNVSIKHVEALLKAGADPRAISPSFLDSQTEVSDLVKTYLKPETNINLSEEKGETQLIECLKKIPVSLDALEKLLNQGANPNLPSKEDILPLFYAICSGQPDVVKLLLEYKTNPNLFLNAKGDLSLCLAVKLSQPEIIKLEIIKLLLQYQANPNQIDAINKTALNYLSETRSDENEACATLLLESGAWPLITQPVLNCSYPSKYDQSGLSAACLDFIKDEPLGLSAFLSVQNLYTRCIFEKDFLEKMENIRNCLSKNEEEFSEETICLFFDAWTACYLHYQGKVDDIKTFIPFIEKEVKDYNENKNTLLHLAVKTKNRVLFDLLLDGNEVHPLPINIKNAEGKTPLSLAVKRSDGYFFKKLCEIIFTTQEALDEKTQKIIRSGLDRFPDLISEMQENEKVAPFLKKFLEPEKLPKLQGNDIFSENLKKNKIAENKEDKNDEVFHHESNTSNKSMNG